jgi:hypothetical protein
MSIRLQVSLLIYMMVQGVLFGIAVITLLVSPLSGHAMQLMPWVVGITAIASVPLSWMIAPRLSARFENRSASLEASSIRSRSALT